LYGGTASKEVLYIFLNIFLSKVAWGLLLILRQFLEIIHVPIAVNWNQLQFIWRN
jgi:hypothetical protein